MTEEEIILRLRAVGQRAVQAALAGTRASVNSLATATDRYGLSLERTTKRGFLMNQMLFTMRRFMYMSTLAITASVFLIGRLGWEYQSSMQQARVALSPVIKGTQALNSELATLFNIAAFTPFQFKDITIAFRQMFLGMRTIGISANTVNQTIQALSDALSATGRTTPAALNRVAVALQHMAYMGHLTGQVVLQLARDGLPIYAALTKELGLTGDQIHNIGALGISSATALHALNKYIETTPGFMNAAMRQSTQTLHGAFTTFKDLLSQAVGRGEGGIFNWLQKQLQEIDLALAPFYKTHRPISMHDIFGAVDTALGTNLVGTMNSLNFAFQQFWGIISNHLIPTLHVFWTVISPVQYALYAIGGLLAVLNHMGPMLDVILGILIVDFTILQLKVIGLGIALKVGETALFAWNLYIRWLTAAQWLYNAAIVPMLIGEDAILYKLGAGTIAWLARGAAVVWNTAVLWLDIAAMEILLYWDKLWLFMNVARIVAWDLLTSSQLFNTVVVWAQVAAWAALDAVMAINPIVLLAEAIAILTIGLIILYLDVKGFHDWVNSHWKYLFAVLFGPLAGLYIAATYLTSNLGQVKSALLAVWSAATFVFNSLVDIVMHPVRALESLINKIEWVVRKLNALRQMIPGQGGGGGFFSGLLHTAIGLSPIGLANSASAAFGGPHYALGGTMYSSGAAMVGERGPEIVHLPGGSRVTPIQNYDWNRGERPLALTIHVTPQDIYLDGEKIGTATSTATADKAARQ